MAARDPSPLWPERSNVIRPDVGAATIGEQKALIAHAGEERRRAAAAAAEKTTVPRAQKRSGARRHGR